MSVVSREEFLRKGHQVNLDMMNVDSVVQGNAKLGIVPVAEISTWNALKNEWQHFYEKNIKDVPFLPWQDTGDLDTWLTRVEAWKAKNQKWAATSGNKLAQERVAALPESPAVLAHRENPPSAKGTPTWVWMGLGTALLAALGYSLSSAARLGGR